MISCSNTYATIADVMYDSFKWPLLFMISFIS